jgi:capsular exopolysaccharide synthesis family protein
MAPQQSKTPAADSTGHKSDPDTRATLTPVPLVVVARGGRGETARELFGAVAVRLGFARPQDVDTALEEQAKQRALGARAERVGTLMLRMGLIADDQLAAVLAEAIRHPRLLSEDSVQIAARVKAVHAHEHNVLVVTGAASGEGATTVAAELAVALALMEQASVALVDANLRAPSLDRLFSVPDAPGLAELCHGATSIEGATHATAVARLRVVPAGGVPNDPLSMLMSSACTDAIAALRTSNRYVVVDAPPMLLYSDAAVLASRADSVLLVIARGRATKREISEIRETLAGLAVPLSGVILTEHAPRPLPWHRRSRRARARWKPA